MMRRIRDCIAVEVREQCLLIARSSGRRAHQVLDVGCLPVGSNDSQAAAEALRVHCAGLTLSAHRIIGVVPLRHAITRNLEIPSVDPREIRSIIDLQAGRQTPYARDEIVLDYLVVGQLHQRYTRVMLVIVNREVLSRILSVLTPAGLTPQAMVFAPEITARFCAGHAPLAIGSRALCALVDVNGRYTDLTVFRAGLPLFTRSIPLGPHGHRPEVFNEQLACELVKSLDTFQAEDGGALPQQVYVSGCAELSADALDRLRGHLTVSVTAVDYGSVLPPQRLAAVQQVDTTSSVLTVVAAVLSAEQATLRLVPDEVKVKQRFETRTRQLMKTAVLSVGLMAVLTALLVVRVYTRVSLYNTLKQEAEMRQEQAAVLEKSLARLRLITHHVRQRDTALELIDALYAVLPARVMLTEFKFDANGMLSLKGMARAMSDVFTFVAILEQEEFFTAVQTNYTSARKQDGEDWAEFGITCSVRRMP